MAALRGAYPELAEADWSEQRLVASAALGARDLLARGGTEATLLAAARLVDPRPLAPAELAYFDRLSRECRDRSIARDLSGRRWPVYASVEVARSRQRDLSRKLAQIDQRLADKLYAAAVSTMREALRRAGVKAQVRARNRSVEAKARLVEEGMTEAVLAAINVRADELLDRAFEGYGSDAEAWIVEANLRRRKAIARAWDLHPNDLDDPDEGNRAAQAAAVLVALLLVRARGALPGTTPAAEPTVGVPFALVRSALRVRDGATVVPGPKGIQVLPARSSPVSRMMAQAAERATPLPDLEALARGEAVPVDLSGVVPALEPHYEWVHGYFGEPAKPFEPHVLLDGVTYTDQTRGMVLAKDPAEWPEGRYEWSVDDHDSCTCYEIVTWEPAGAGYGADDGE